VYGTTETEENIAEIGKKSSCKKVTLAMNDFEASGHESHETVAHGLKIWGGKKSPVFKL